MCKQWHWCVGNHELYNFTTSEWVRRMFTSGKNPEERSYYDFSPAAGWRVVLVDTYEISQMHPEGSAAYAQARRVLEANNPNDTLTGFDWFNGWVPPE
jgi:manganese-dependent ADP-ribose/CDP-alcohol diphosphatase